jgi:flagellar biosynthesis component FlhA
MWDKTNCLLWFCSIFLNIKETGISGLTGTDCTVLSEYQNMRTAGVYTGIVILLSTACCVICAVVYGKILFVICVQMKKERTDKAKSNNYQMDISSELTSKETQQVSTSQLNDVPSISSSLGKNVYEYSYCQFCHYWRPRIYQ